MTRWKKFLLVSYFFFWAKPISFWEKLTIFIFVYPVFQYTHIIANSSLSIANQERRERNLDNEIDQLKTAFQRRAYYIAQSLHNTRTFIFIYTLEKL